MDQSPPLSARGSLAADAAERIQRDSQRHKIARRHRQVHERAGLELAESTAVQPRARIPAKSACACASAEGPPDAPTPGSTCGVPASWPFMALSALDACTS